LRQEAYGKVEFQEERAECEVFLSAKLPESVRVVLQLCHLAASGLFEEASHLLRAQLAHGPWMENPEAQGQCLDILIRFLEDLPPGPGVSLLIDEARYLFDENVEGAVVSEPVIKEPNKQALDLPSSHLRTLERIFEPALGLKRLNQVNLRRDQVAQLFKAMGWMGAFERFGKGSHHCLGVKTEVGSASTVLSEERVPPYQIRQLQKMLMKVGLVPAGWEAELQIKMNP
jgi:hypothetical protein